MLKVKLLPVDLINREILLFKKSRIKNFSFFLPLLDEEYHLLSPLEIIPENLNQVNCYILEEPFQNISTIIEYHEDILGRKFNLYEKIYFYQQFNLKYPSVNQEILLKSLGFNPQKKEIISYILNLSTEKLELMEEKGVSSLRDLEYFYEISKTKFDEILIQSNLPKNRFKLALNAAFELYKTERLKDFSDLNPNDTEIFLNTKRYPEFFSFLQNYQNSLSQVKHPKNIKITTPPFFEGNKLTIEIEIKNSQQLAEFFTFLEKEKKHLEELVAKISQ